MPFLGNLAKIFVRSGVNQDSLYRRKVIINNVYGDGQLTLIRNENGEIQNLKSDSTQTINRADLQKKGYKKEIFSNSVLMNFFILIGSFGLPIFGSLYYLIIFFRDSLKTNTKFYIIKQQATYKKDKKHSAGRRLSGYINVKEYSLQKIPATKFERIIYITKSIIAFGLSSTTSYFWYQVFTN